MKNSQNQSDSSDSNALVTGTSLVVLASDGPGSSEGGARAGGSAAGLAGEPGSLVPYVGAAVIAAFLGWFAGAQTTALSFSQMERKAFEAAFSAEMLQHASALAAVEARLAAIESSAGVSDTAQFKRLVEGLGHRLDEMSRSHSVIAGHANARSDKFDRDFAQRLERLEKQTSSSFPVASLPALPKPQEAVAKAGDKPSYKSGDKQLGDKQSAKSGAPLPSYVLREVFRGGALIEGRQGLMEVTPGVQLPGAGRVQGVERREGRWVLVTSLGFIQGR